MKKLLLFISILFILSCNKNSNINNNIKITDSNTNKKDSIATIIGNVSPDDDVCIGEIEDAKRDLENNKLTYYVRKEPITYGNYTDELKKLLRPLGIKCEKLSGIGNCIPLVNSRSGCYFDYMNAGIKQKFKNGFIDSLETQAMKTYIAKNIDYVIAYIDVTSKAKFYSKSKTYKTQRQDAQADFIKYFTFPKSFNQNNPWKANTSFIIHRDGSIKISNINIEFGNESDKQFEKYFRKQVESFVLETKWIIYQIEELKIDSEVYLTFTNNEEYF